MRRAIRNKLFGRRNRMKKMVLSFILLSIFCVSNIYAGEFTLKSSELEGQLTDDQVFSGFGCSGKNMSPQLTWINAPKATRSFAVTVYDPDAPTGSGFWHWLIFNIPGGINELPTDAGNMGKKLAPAGSIQSVTDFGQPGFGGACPPPGDAPHRYVFTVYALDTESLELKAETQAALVGFYLNKHAVAKASIVAYYGR
jgi:hypothetical protein